MYSMRHILYNMRHSELYSYKDSNDCHPQGNSRAECLFTWTPTLDFFSTIIYDTVFQTSIRGNLFCRSIKCLDRKKGDPLCLLPQTPNSLLSLKSIPTVHQSSMASHPPSPATGLMLCKHKVTQCLQAVSTFCLKPALLHYCKVKK